MIRPIKKDFMTGHPQMDHHTDLSNYHDALEKYADVLENKLNYTGFQNGTCVIHTYDTIGNCLICGFKLNAI